MTDINDSSKEAQADLSPELKLELGLTEQGVPKEDTSGSVVIEPIPVPPEVIPTWYLFRPIGDGVGIWEGQTVQQKEQPENSTLWEPTLVPQKDESIYNWDGVWHIGPTLGTEKAKTKLKELVTTQFNMAAQSLGTGYASFEQDTWPTQKSEAQIVLNGGTSNYLNTLASLRQQDVRQLAQSITQKASTYDTGYAILLGNYQVAMAGIDAGRVTLPMTFLVDRYVPPVQAPAEGS